MSDIHSACPKCASNETHHRKSRGDWVCDQCDHVWKLSSDALAPELSTATRPSLFLSYGRDRDGKALADRLCVDLAAGFDVWRDTREIVAGQSWQHEITDGLRKAQVVVYLMTPHSTRVSTNRDSRDQVDSVCLGEIAYALFQPPPRPVVPVLAARGAEPPLAIFHLDYVDLAAWQQSEDQYQAGLRRLLDGVAAALRGEKRYRKWHHQLNPWDFAALLNEKRAGFCGREWLFDAIDAWRSAHQERALLITGDPGVGKSALVAELVFLNPGGQVLAYHCCQADTPETLRPARFVRSVAAMLAGQLPEYAAQLDDPTVQEALSVGRCEQDPASAFEEGILVPLEHVPAPADGGVRYLLIDALDEAVAQRAAGLTIVDLLASRLGRLPGWLRIVATTRKEPAVLDRLRGLRAHTLDAQDPRNRDDLARFLDQCLRSPQLAALLAAARLSAAEASDRLLDKSAGNFLYLKQVLAGLETGEVDLAGLDQLPPGLVGWYLRFFERHFPDAASYSGAREVLAVLVAAQQPLSREEIAAAVRLGPDVSLARVLRQLASFLHERPGPAGTLGFTLYHKSLADWLTDARLDGSLHHIGLEPGHARLADAGWDAYRRGVSSLSPYMLRHLPFHLTQSRRWDDLIALLTDPCFLEAKTSAGLVFELADDLEQAAASVPVERLAQRLLALLEKCLRRTLHFVAAHPETLFQGLWNAGWFYDCSQAADYHVEPEGGWGPAGPPWHHAGRRLSELLESWRAWKKGTDSRWVRFVSPLADTAHLLSANVLCGHQLPVRGVAFSPDGRRLMSGSHDMTVRVWDVRSGSELAVGRGHTRWVASVAYSSDGRRLASAADDGTVRVWDAETGRELLTLAGHEGEVRGVDFSPDGRRLVSASADATWRLWDVDTGRQLLCTRGHDPAGAPVPLYHDRQHLVSTCTVADVAFSPDGSLVVTGGFDLTVRVWDAATGEERVCCRGHEKLLRAVAFAPDSRHIASAADDRTARVWSVQDGSEILRLYHADALKCVTFSRDGTRLATGCDDGTVRVWDWKSGRQLARLGGHWGVVNSVAFSPGDRLLASAAQDRTIRLWQLQLDSRPASLVAHTDWIDTVVFTPDGLYLLTASNDGALGLWDAATGRLRRFLRGHNGPVKSVAASPDSRLAATAGADGTVRLWSLSGGAEAGRLPGHQGAANRLAWSADGRLLLTGGDDCAARLWEVATCRETACLAGHHAHVYGVALSADGRNAAAGAADGTIRLWRRDGASFIPSDLVLTGPRSTVSRLAFTPDGKQLVCVYWAKTMRVWDAVTGQCLREELGIIDAQAVAAETAVTPWRAVARGWETLIIVPVTGAVAARVLGTFNNLATHLSGRAWAGAAGNQLLLFALEGGTGCIS